MRLLSHGLVAPTQRTIPDFELDRPRTIADAIAAGSAPGAVYAQGCTDLFAQFREGLRCERLVSLDAVAELRAIESDGSALQIGAAVEHHAGARHPAVTAALPGLADGWRQVANHRVRQRATIGGNVMARRPRYEMSIMLDSLGAKIEFSRQNGRVWHSVGDVWDGQAGEGALLTSILIPEVRGTWFGYERSLRPLLTVAATVRAGTIRMSTGSEYQRHFTVEAPLGTDPADIAALLPDEIGDAAGSAWYRKHAAGVLLGRLLAGYRAATAGQEN